MHQLRQPTQKQISLAKSLGLSVRGESFRVLSAKIADTLEVRAFETVHEQGIRPGIKVEYVGDRSDMPERLIVSTVARNGYLFFRGTPKYCRPWDVHVRIEAN